MKPRHPDPVFWSRLLLFSHSSFFFAFATSDPYLSSRFVEDGSFWNLAPLFNYPPFPPYTFYDGILFRAPRGFAGRRTSTFCAGDDLRRLSISEFFFFFWHVIMAFLISWFSTYRHQVTVRYKIDLLSGGYQFSLFERCLRQSSDFSSVHCDENAKASFVFTR